MTQKNKLIAFVLCGIALLVLPLILQQFGNAWCASSTSRCSTPYWRWG